jgi:glycosyltransferase involved in cell wall biosynthesis
MRIALVHDYLNQLGGAERVFQEIAGLFPEAPIYTLLADPRVTRALLPGRTIITSSLQRFPGILGHHHYALWLMPSFIERFDFSQFDLVISSSSSFAKGVITPPYTRHISYCATPLRYVWDDYHGDRQEFPFMSFVRPLVPYATHYMRVWDFYAAARPDALMTNSQYSRARLKKYYGRDAEVVYPPVDIERFQALVPDPNLRAARYFLMVGRLTPYKRFDLAIKTFNDLGLPLWIVGDGPQKRALMKEAGPHIRFLGRVGETRLEALYASAEAFLFPQEEHFGLVAVEAMAAGTPVIGYHGGGAVEIVTEGRSGVFFNTSTPEGLAHAVTDFRRSDFDPALVRKESARFHSSVFREEFLKFVSASF